MWKSILKIFTLGGYMKRGNNDGLWKKLLKEDTNVSAMNFFLICTLAVGIILLFIPAVAMCVDVWFNHWLHRLPAQSMPAFPIRDLPEAKW